MIIPNYIPPFLWRFWSSNVGRNIAGSSESPRLRAYDVYSDTLFDAREEDSFLNRSVFQDLKAPDKLFPRVRAVLGDAEQAFNSLQDQAEQTLNKVIHQIYLPSQTATNTKINVKREDLLTLAKFLSFLRFRNSSKYSNIVDSLWQDQEPFCRSHVNADQEFDHRQTRIGQIISPYNDFIQQMRYEFLLKTFIKFLRADNLRISKGMSTLMEISSNVLHESSTLRPELSSHTRADPWLEAFDIHCWKFCREAEVSFGVASEEDGQEFILPETCFVTLDESIGCDIGDDQQDDMTEPTGVFFPILPTLALYILCGGTAPQTSNVVIDVGEELYSDIHLRNAMVLSTVTIYFCSLSSIARSISSYDLSRARWMIDRYVDYSHLKKKCRHMFLMEGVTKMLAVKGDLMVIDLTDEVKIIGKDPLACGAFSDVWMGKWYDRVERVEHRVAIKYLRQVMVQNVREKFLKRLQEEIHVWHQLSHRNLATLYGLVQTSTSVGMVSLWCDNGTICQYIKKDSRVDKLQLLIQIASGISYLHHFVPPVVHGDLKAGNILIDTDGHAIITDFGLSKVMETMSSPIQGPIPTSFFAGSTRWMAPELLQSLVEDGANTKLPQVTTFSDVYAFGSVITGQLPYPHRTNDYQVTVDILQGVKPSRGALAISCEQLGIKKRTTVDGEDSLYRFLDSCWNAVPFLRPKMEEAVGFFVGLNSQV
ncbi:kinase-like protein [Marasmius fiardii PR-910]|nr:kinase-like protein [Marasmius fiardii PR-910]